MTTHLTPEAETAPDATTSVPSAASVSVSGLTHLADVTALRARLMRELELAHAGVLYVPCDEQGGAR
jgi:hypothetical protein